MKCPGSQPGHEEQPRPEPVRRTAPPVTTMSTIATSAASATNRNRPADTLMVRTVCHRSSTGGSLREASPRDLSDVTYVGAATSAQHREIGEGLAQCCHLTAELMRVAFVELGAFVQLSVALPRRV